MRKPAPNDYETYNEYVVDLLRWARDRRATRRRIGAARPVKSSQSWPGLRGYVRGSLWRRQ